MNESGKTEKDKVQLHQQDPINSKRIDEVSRDIGAIGRIRQLKIIFLLLGNISLMILQFQRNVSLALHSFLF